MSTGEDPDDEVLISIAASTGRRWIAVACVSGLGLLLLTLVFEPIGGLWRLVFLGCGIAAFLAAEKLRISTRETIELTRRELRTGQGRVLTRLDNIKAVERGALAFKPSNGFLVRLHAAAGRGWAPGIWWQRGRLLGIGGVIAGGKSRAMAEILSALLLGQLPDGD